MDFLKALELSVNVIREQESELDEIYLYERNSETRVYLKDCEGSLQFMRDEPLHEQIFLTSCLDRRFRSKCVSLEVILSSEWGVRLRKTEHLIAQNGLGKASEAFIDYTPVGREGVADV